MRFVVESAGLLTTVQDLGRPGHQGQGLSPGGAMDPVALRIANLLVGNAEDAAGLEVTLQGPTLRFEGEGLLALAGADLGATLGGIPVPRGRAVLVRDGDRLVFAAGSHTGVRTYIAIAGGVDVPPVLGSRSTDLRAGLGGLAGRPLARHDVLAVGAMQPMAQHLRQRLARRDRTHAWWGAGAHLPSARSAEPVVRATRGLEHDWFPADQQQAFWRQAWIVSPRSDRMGVRLGGASLTLEPPREMVSSPVANGTVQVPPAGEPIVLGADRQTVGGYPRIAQVVDVDLPLVAQLAPGTRVRFHEVSAADAVALLLARERSLRDLAHGLALEHGT